MGLSGRKVESATLHLHLAVARLHRLVERDGGEAALAQVVDRVVGRDLVEPRREGVLRGVRAEGAEGLDVGLLHEVLHVFRAAHEAADVVREPPLVLLHERLVGRLVAVEGAGNKAPVLLARRGRGRRGVRLGHGQIAARGKIRHSGQALGADRQGERVHGAGEGAGCRMRRKCGGVLPIPVACPSRRARGHGTPRRARPAPACYLRA